MASNIALTPIILVVQRVVGATPQEGVLQALIIIPIQTITEEAITIVVVIIKALSIILIQVAVVCTNNSRKLSARNTKEVVLKIQTPTVVATISSRITNIP